MSTCICVSLPAQVLSISSITSNIISLVWGSAAGFSACVPKCCLCLCGVVPDYVRGHCRASNHLFSHFWFLWGSVTEAGIWHFWISYHVSEVQWPSCLHRTQNWGYRSMPMCMHAPHVCFMWILSICKIPYPLSYLPASPSVPLFFLPCLLEIESDSLCSPGWSGTRQASNSQKSALLCLMSSGIKCMHHNTWLLASLLTEPSSQGLLFFIC